MPNSIARLVGGVPMPLIVIGPDLLVAEANVAAQALFAVSGEGLVGRHHGLLIRAPELLSAIERALRHGQGAVVRLVTAQASHDQVYEVTVTPLDAAVLLAFADLTEAEQMDRMRRDFVANVSHELRTPLTAISGFVETLRGAAKDDPAARERFLAIMAAEAERMNRLVRDLLHLSRVEAEERIRPETRVDLAAIARSVADSLQPLARSSDVRLDLVGAQDETLVRADSDQMVQVLTNLTENAIKYGSPAGATVTLALSRATGPRGPVLRVDVVDQGAGIDARHIPRLTERFYRVDSHRSRAMGGTGLGLAIVKHIVQRHRGRLVIESEIGKGSKFSILIPLA